MPKSRAAGYAFEFSRQHSIVFLIIIIIPLNMLLRKSFYTNLILNQFYLYFYSIIYNTPFLFISNKIFSFDFRSIQLVLIIILHIYMWVSIDCSMVLSFCVIIHVSHL